MELPFSYFLKRPNYWPDLLFMAFGWLIAHLPISIQMTLASCLSWFLLKFASSRKQIAEINFKLCFPNKSDAERAVLLRQNFRETTIGIVEIASCWFTDLKSRKKQTKLVGKQHLEKAQSKGKGVILLSFHLTNLEMGGCLLGQHFPITAMYKPNKNKLIERLMRLGRLKHIKALVRQNDARSAIKALKKNQILWYATDQNNGANINTFVPFFGTQASSVTATTKFAKLTGATVVPFTQKRSLDGKSYILEIHPALDDFPGISPEADAIRINAFLEDYLKLNPETYLWLHQRFRARPEGESSIYPHKSKKRRP